MDTTNELDTEVAALIEAELEVGRAWGRAARARLVDAGISVLEVQHFERPDSCPIVLIGPDEEGAATIVEMATKFRSPVVLFVDGSSDEDTRVLSFHLAWNGTWVTVASFLISVGDDEEDEGDEAYTPISDDRRQELGQMLRDVVDDLEASDEPEDHRNQRLVLNAVLERTAKLELPSHEWSFLFLYMAQSATELTQRLMDLHRGKFFTEADTYARQILADVKIPRDAKLDVIRAASYRYMKQLDPKCTTKSEVSSITAALEALVRAQ